jgi:hypothetical protein
MTSKSPQMPAAEIVSVREEKERLRMMAPHPWIMPPIIGYLESDHTGKQGHGVLSECVMLGCAPPHRCVVESLKH